jgi:type IV pilus assembly protein PilY1
MRAYDNSGSLTYAFTPDYVDDTSTGRSRSLMSGGTHGCTVGQSPFNTSATGGAGPALTPSSS